MKRILRSLFLLFSFSVSLNAQMFMEGFENNYLPPGWDTLNLSGPTPGVVKAWFPSSQFTTPPPAKQGISFYGANYEAEGNNGTISSWLFTPVRTLNNGDIFQFYTLTLGSGTYPDRLEIRMSTNGASINAGGTPASTGDFSTLLGVVNPSLTSTGYPGTWAKFVYTLSGLPGGGLSGRMAFRYFVTNGGVNGSNGDAIGLDSVFYKPNLTAGIASNQIEGGFRIFPNPANSLVKLYFAVPADQREVTVQNSTGEIILKEKADRLENEIDLSSFVKGVYFISIRENDVVRTQKLILL